MGSQQGSEQGGFAPFFNPFQSYLDNFAAVAQAFAPAKGLARWQLEMMGFATRRAQACLEFPSRLTQCRTPEDVANEQLRFWREASEQVMESSQRVVELWTQMFVPAAPESRRERDYITFPEPRDASQGGRRPRERRIA
jgi:hypothetical protein